VVAGATVPVVQHTVQALVFDFDGTLVDSDAALVAPFEALGVPREEISFGHAIATECERLGISMDHYVELYDQTVVQPFPGVAAVVPRLPRWALCSNKHPVSGVEELRRLGWEPEGALFADHFDWEHKSIAPVLEFLDLPPDDFVNEAHADDGRNDQDAPVLLAPDQRSGIGRRGSGWFAHRRILVPSTTGPGTESSRSR